MPNTYSLVGTIHKYNLDVAVAVNASVTYVQGVQSNKTGQELQDQFAAYAADIEEGVKHRDWSCWATEDTARNASFTLTAISQPDENGITLYDCTVSFTIQNAIASTSTTIESELPAEELEEQFQNAADSAAAEWLAQRSFIPL